MTTAIPMSTAEVTAEWLTTALQSGGTLPSTARVAELTVDDGAAGVGFMGSVGRIEVTYEGEGHGDAPTSMVVKFPTDNPDIMAMMHPTRVYEREHRFYAELADSTPVRTPDVYHVTCDVSDDPSSERYVLVMEDLYDLELGDQVAGLSVDQTEKALRGLAAHHARFWNGVGLESADFIPDIDGPLNLAGQAIYDASLPGFLELFGDQLVPELRPVAEVYGSNHPLFLGRFAAMPHTLVHFDYRADNLFFEGDDVVVIDFQSISKGGGAADVGYLMGQNLDTDVRREHEHDLLRTYHQTLLDNGVTGYDFEQFHEDYQVGVMYGWVIPVFATGTLDSSSERAMALWTNVLERLQDAILHHDAHRFIER
ncbi:MAG: phosphotransferase [Actinomycetota bacterium]